MANRYFLNTGNTDWNTAANWSTSSGGAGGASVPTSSDAAFFDANSGNCAVSTTGRTCANLTCTGYTGTITLNVTLTCSGTITLVPTMTLAYTATGQLIMSGTSWTLFSGGLVIAVPFAFNMGNSGTQSIGDNCTFAENVIIQTVNATGAQILNGLFTMTCLKSLSWNPASASSLSGTATIVMGGTGTLSQVATTGDMRHSIEINTAGTVTLGNIRYRTGVFKYTTGTVVSTGSSFTINANATITCNGAGFNLGAVSIIGGTTITFDGTHGFTMYRLTCTVVSIILNLKSTCTYAITNEITLMGSVSAPFQIRGATASSAAFLNYSGSTSRLAATTFQDIDASGGSALYGVFLTLTRTANITNDTTINPPSGGSSKAANIFASGIIVPAK